MRRCRFAALRPPSRADGEPAVLPASGRCRRGSHLPGRHRLRTPIARPSIRRRKEAALQATARRRMRFGKNGHFDPDRRFDPDRQRERRPELRHLIGDVAVGCG